LFRKRFLLPYREREKHLIGKLNSMKTLHLTILRAYFDEILQGKKKEEYREASPYWLRRLKQEADHRRPLTFTHVAFRNGYNPDSPSLTIELEDIELMTFRQPQGKKERLFVLFLGKLISTRHLKPEQKRLLSRRRAKRPLLRST
jgi:hypothetical protein